MTHSLPLFPLVCCSLLSLCACSSGDSPAPTATPIPDAGLASDSQLAPEGSDDGVAPEAATPDDGAATEAAIPDVGVDASEADTAPDAALLEDAATVTEDDLLPAAAEAICSALFRCCDEDSQARYFTAATSKPSLEGFAAQVPPATAMDEAGCRAVVAQMLAVALASWVENVKAGRVSFVPQALGECVGELQAAACGKPVAAALADGTCFSFDPPPGGLLQRRMFARTSGVGAACAPIMQDGFGAGFYGTCDPAVAFCCIDDPSNPAGGCGLPKSGLDGTCQSAGDEGETCEVMPPLELCKTGLSCDAMTAKCIAQLDEALSLGETCVDSGYNLLGTCENGWCDIFDTKKCEAYKADGQECFDGSECESGECTATGTPHTCTAWSLCVGS